MYLIILYKILFWDLTVTKIVQSVKFWVYVQHIKPIYNVLFKSQALDKRKVYLEFRALLFFTSKIRKGKANVKQYFEFLISVFNQLDAQNLFHNKFYFMPVHISSTCSHHQEVKIALHTLWYHYTYRCNDTRGCVMQFWPPDDEHMVLETCRGMK